MIQSSLLILAAGMGSRYGGFKQMDPVGPDGELIIDYSIHDALRAGFGKIIIVTRPEMEEPMRGHFEKTLGGGSNIVFAFQRLDDLPDGFAEPQGREKPWGTGQAVWAARNVIAGPFAVINADDFYGAGSYRLLHDFLAQERAGEFCMVGFELAKTLSRHGSVSRGICEVDAEGCLVKVTEHGKIISDATFGARSEDEDGTGRSLPADSVASMNCWGFTSSVMGLLEAEFREFLSQHGKNMKSEFFLPSAIDVMIKRKKARCRVLVTDEQWFGMTYKEDRELAAAAVRRLIADGVYPG